MPRSEIRRNNQHPPDATVRQPWSAESPPGDAAHHPQIAPAPTSAAGQALKHLYRNKIEMTGRMGRKWVELFINRFATSTTTILTEG